MKVSELIEQLKEMPQDFNVCFWVGEDRVDIIEVRNVGDVVDLYEEEGGDAETFKERVYELAFGDDAINKDYSDDEVLTILREFSDKALEGDE